jgi:hypothetical protein
LPSAMAGRADQRIYNLPQSPVRELAEPSSLALVGVASCLDAR